MPEKSRERRVQIAKRQGKSTAIKASDVGRAGGLSAHAAKKSKYVVGMRDVEERHVSRKKPPPGSRRVEESADLGNFEVASREARVAGTERGRSVQRVLSRRSPSVVAAKQARKKKS